MSFFLFKYAHQLKQDQQCKFVQNVVKLLWMPKKVKFDFFDLLSLSILFTVVPPSYLQFHFPQFQLLQVNHYLEADDPPDVSSES